MATLKDLQFTKDWRNPADFPTYEDSETKVRADQQLLFNEIQTHINEVVQPALQEVDGKKLIRALRLQETDRHLWVIYTDGTEEDVGIIEVEAGATGPQGAPGEDGVGILSVAFNFETGKWDITYTDNNVVSIDGPVVPTSLSQLTEDETHRVVTDAEKGSWTGKMDKAGGTFTGAVYAMAENGVAAQLRNTALVFVETTPTNEGQINWLCE